MLKQWQFIPRLETERLVLRALAESDVEDLRKWLGREEIYTYWGRPASRGEKSPERLFLDPRPHVHRKPSHDFIWGIELQSTHEMIGLIEIFDVENDRFGMIGYRIAPWLWGCGICSEALRRVVQFIFIQTGLDRLEGHADVRNIGSNRVLEKSGFRLEGTIRHGKIVSQYCDFHIWGQLREDLAETK